MPGTCSKGSKLHNPREKETKLRFDTQQPLRGATGLTLTAVQAEAHRPKPATVRGASPLAWTGLDLALSVVWLA